MARETCFTFLNTLPVANGSPCSISVYLFWKMLFFIFGKCCFSSFGDVIACSLLMVNWPGGRWCDVEGYWPNQCGWSVARGHCCYWRRWRQVKSDRSICEINLTPASPVVARVALNLYHTGGDYSHHNL